MAIPSKLYIRLNRPRSFMVLDDVSDYQLTHWYEPSSYRDSWKVDTTANAGDAGGASTVAISGVPVIAEPGSTIVSDASTLSAIATAPDEMAHVPPRISWEPVRGYVFSIDGTAIPEVEEPRYKAQVFTANATTDVCTSTAHTFDNGDIVSVHSSGTLVSGLSSALLYELIKVDANSFRLARSGAVVDITNAQSGSVHTVVLVTPKRLPLKTPGMVYIPSSRDPEISTTDPR